MGGGRGRGRKSGRSIPTRDGASASRKAVFSGDRLPVACLDHHESKKIAGCRTMNESRLQVFGHSYPDAAAAVDVSETFNDDFVHLDLDPDQAVDVPSYEYHPAVASGFGLGYSAEREDEEEEEAVPMQLGGDEMDGLDFYSTPVISKSKFLTIGGVRIYTEDTSSPDEGQDGFGSDGESSDSDARRTTDTDESNSSYGEEEEEDDSDGSSDGDSCSDIDEELADDYLEGIGGSSELLKAEWLTTVNLDKSGKNDLIKGDGSRHNRGGYSNKLGGIALLNASMEYGMKKPKFGRGKGSARPRQFGSPIVDYGFPELDDLLFAKDSRTGSGKKKQKRHPPLSRSWPGEKNNKYDGFPGGKKKYRKELIAMKRRQRMINRGVNLDQINKKLRELVVNDGDMFSFQPMHSRDCSQVQRLASIYQLRSGCQGSGKKRFVTVTRTERTVLPSLKDKDRLDKLLGLAAEDEDFVISSGRVDRGRFKGVGRFGSAPRSKPRAETCQSAPSKSSKSKNCGDEKKQTARLGYSEKPVAFISCGMMQADSAAEDMASCSIETKEVVEVAETSSSKLGAFEMHTKGFGSRMLSKMGFVEGGGLGKSGQGMVHPIESIKRPKSLGLGIDFAETATANSTVEMVGRIGAFEKHTKGFGSRLMTKMGFVPGSGLGRDAQGITDPLTAVRRPRGRGLGST